jgi:glycerol-3-phosphate dehydrogenase
VSDSSPSADVPRSDVELIVIGAGINGAGIARDAAMRGLRVLLLDKGDVASGTTSWSSRLIHGGLRYLEHGELGLVRESLHERKRLLHIAPHLVQPLPMLIPIYRGQRRGPWLIRAGMMLYDALSLDKSLPWHQMLDARAAQSRAPGLLSPGLRAAALYYDGQATFAERLALENALDARIHGAQLRTYHRVEHILTDSGVTTGVSGYDVLTGEPFRAAAPVVINVAGPWVDTVLAGAPESARTRLIGGTKGSHIVVASFSGAPRDALYSEARQDGRPFFIIPWNDAYLIGTTDTRYEGDLSEVVATDADIGFLLAETNLLIPDATLTRDDVRYSYAGVRPLPFSPGVREGSVSRHHHIQDHGASGGPKGLYSIVGGKLTTYRELAEQTVDLVQRQLGRHPVRSQTAEVPLPGARTNGSWPEFQDRFRRESLLPAQSTDHLLRVYGTRAPDLLATATTPELRESIDPLSGAIAAEVPWAFVEEGARTLADVIARRMMIGLGLDAGVGADVTTADIAVKTLGWDPARADDEVRAYREWIRRYRPRALETVAASV